MFVHCLIEAIFSLITYHSIAKNSGAFSLDVTTAIECLYYLPLTFLSCSSAASITYREERLSPVLTDLPVCGFHSQLSGKQSGIANCPLLEG